MSQFPCQFVKMSRSFRRLGDSVAFWTHPARQGLGSSSRGGLVACGGGTPLGMAAGQGAVAETASRPFPPQRRRTAWVCFGNPKGTMPVATVLRSGGGTPGCLPNPQGCLTQRVHLSARECPQGPIFRVTLVRQSVRPWPRATPASTVPERPSAGRCQRLGGHPAARAPPRRIRTASAVGTRESTRRTREKAREVPNTADTPSAEAIQGTTRQRVEAPPERTVAPASITTWILVP